KGEDGKKKQDLEFSFEHVLLWGRGAISNLQIAGTTEPDRNIRPPMFLR
ncbi:hypothetical protein EMGBD2_11180, partial [Nitrospirota bacterium]